jgi:hypothetical protein
VLAFAAPPLAEQAAVARVAATNTPRRPAKFMSTPYVSPVHCDTDGFVSIFPATEIKHGENSVKLRGR